MSIYRFRADSAINVTDRPSVWREVFSLLLHTYKLYFSRKQNRLSNSFRDIHHWFWKHIWNNIEHYFVSLSSHRMYPSWTGLRWQGCLETRAMPNLCVRLGVCSLRWHHLWRSGAGLSQPRDSLWRVLSSLSTNNTTTYKSKFVLSVVTLVLPPSWFMSTSNHFLLDPLKHFSLNAKLVTFWP